MGRGLLGNIRPPGKGNEKVQYRTGSCERQDVYSLKHEWKTKGSILGRGLRLSSSLFIGWRWKGHF